MERIKELLWGDILADAPPLLELRRLVLYADQRLVQIVCYKEDVSIDMLEKLRECSGKAAKVDWKLCPCALLYY